MTGKPSTIKASAGVSHKPEQENILIQYTSTLTVHTPQSILTRTRTVRTLTINTLFASRSGLLLTTLCGHPDLLTPQPSGDPDLLTLQPTGDLDL